MTNTGDASGRVVVLNGVPRSGKSSIARALQDQSPAVWMHLGVDSVMAMTPPAQQPGIGLRPGGERPDLEPFVKSSYAALFDSAVAHASHGLNVVVDVGVHDAFSRSLGIWVDAARRLDEVTAYLVGVHCSLDVIMERRADSIKASDAYLSRRPDGSIPEPVRLWQEAVHAHGVYDVSLKTDSSTPAQCVDVLEMRLARRDEPRAFAEIRRRG